MLTCVAGKVVKVLLLVHEHATYTLGCTLQNCTYTYSNGSCWDRTNTVLQVDRRHSCCVFSWRRSCEYETGTSRKLESNSRHVCDKAKILLCHVQAAT